MKQVVEFTYKLECEFSEDEGNRWNNLSDADKLSYISQAKQGLNEMIEDELSDFTVVSSNINIDVVV